MLINQRIKQRIKLLKPVERLDITSMKTSITLHIRAV